MIFAHTFTSIEVELAHQVGKTQKVSQIDIREIKEKKQLRRLHNFHSPEILLYSFQMFDKYSFLHSFEDELQAVKILLEYAIEHGIRKIIVMSYPGSYYNSSNLFLQHKGEIEKLFVSSGIPCTILLVQGIMDTKRRRHNFHSLFFRASQGTYVLPKTKNKMMYSISLSSLVSIVFKCITEDHYSKYDVFDRAFDLQSFFKEASVHIPIRFVSPQWLYWECYQGNYISPTMLELFLQPTLPMFNFRTQKEFNVHLGLLQLQESVVAPSQNAFSMQENTIQVLQNVHGY